MGALTRLWGDAVEVEQVDLCRLKPNPDNPRKNDPAVDAVVRSIRAYGFNNPIITDADLNIAAGHTRLKAALQMGLETVPVIRIPGLTGSKFTGYAIADNQTATIATWDDGKLHELVAQLNLEDDFDIASLGFSDNDLADILRDEDADAGIDEEPEPPAVPVTQPGDLWLLGPHRLYCGDSTLEASARSACGGLRPFIMVTDPPYGVEYDPQWRLNSGLNKAWQTRAEGVVLNDESHEWAAAYDLFLGPVAYVWHGGRFAANVAINLRDAGFDLRGQIIWAKQALVIGRGHYHWQHEPCWYAVRKGKSSKWCGDRTQSTVWSIPNVHRTQGDANDGRSVHCAQKPVECMERPMRNHGKRGDIVYDPFVGSGTSIVAAERCGRVCCAIELDPGYCDVSVERWEHLTGGKAKREAACA